MKTSLSALFSQRDLILEEIGKLIMFGSTRYFDQDGNLITKWNSPEYEEQFNIIKTQLDSINEIISGYRSESTGIL